MLPRRVLLAVIQAWVLASWSEPAQVQAQAQAQAQTQDDERYRGAVEEAVKEFGAGRWAEARSLFLRAHAISPNARTFRGLGMCAYELRMYARAIEELEAALLDSRKPLPEAMQTHVKKLLAGARAFVGRLRIEATPAAADVLVDGRRVPASARGVVLLDAGVHTISASAPGYRADNLSVQVEGGRADTVRIQLESAVPLEPPLPLAVARPSASPAPIAAPPPKPDPTPAHAQPTNRAPAAPVPAPIVQGGSHPSEDPSLAPYAWVTIAGAVAFGVGAGAFWAVGESQYEDLRSGCAPGCSDAEISDSGVQTSDLLTNGFLALSLLSGVTSIVLFAIDGNAGAEAPAQVQVHPSGAGVKGRF